MSSLAVIIPALLRSENDHLLLEHTIRKVPWRPQDELILVTQVQRAAERIRSYAPHLHWTHFDNPLTKWKAIDLARAYVPPESDFIVLLDADDPLSRESLHDALRVAEGSGFDLLLGQRTQIALRASDELSPRSRLYLEIFSNALLLLRLGGMHSTRTSCPDIQSGFYLVGRKWFESLQLDYIGAYGGELALYYQLANASCRIVQAPIQARASAISSYNLERIVTDIFALPFFAGVTDTEIETAQCRAPQMYACYLNQADESDFDREIVKILALRKVL